MSYYLRETAQGLSKEQTTEILDKFAEFEATYTSETRKFRNALVEEKKSRKSFFGGFKKRNRASRAIKQSNDSTPFSIELESTSSVMDEGILRDEDYMTKFMEQADDGLADKEEDIQQILDQISLPGGCSKCDSEMESICVAEGETLQSVDIGHYTSTTVSSADEDDISGDQDGEILVDVSPDWPEDAFKDRMTNLDILHTWRDDVQRIIDEENTLRPHVEQVSFVRWAARALFQGFLQ
ncbi:hypothetical protein DPV78_003579 [Talaromyces pinophilus]|nr:hypothetical protein DPV78_003579 [Talaromyces pinophilus]